MKSLKNKQTIEQLLADRNISYKEIEFNESVAASINNYTQTHPVDLICLTNYDHTFFERLLNEPVIKKVGFHTIIPLLIISI